MTNAVTLAQYGGVSPTFRNRIINGAMVIDQRNAGASSTPTTVGAYTYSSVDRFFYLISAASKFTMQQNAGSVTPPAGFANYLGITSSSAYSIGGSDYFLVGQSIEGFNTADLNWGTVNAKTVTLSFQVYSSLTGTFGGALMNGGSNYSYPFTYTISSANTWTTVSITVVGPTSGTWIGATNGVGLRVFFGLGVNSSLSGTAGSWSANGYYSATGATSVVGTSGATFYITGVQLEVGSSATGYEYVNYQTSLANCQRYYQKSFPVATAPVQNSGLYTLKWTQLKSGYGTRIFIPFIVSMRATPTVTGFNGGNTNNLVRNIPSATDITNIGFEEISSASFCLLEYGGAGDNNGDPVGWNWTASAEL